MTDVQKNLFVIVIITLCICLTGCSEQASNPTTAQIIKLQNEQDADEKPEPDDYEVKVSMPSNENSDHQKQEESAHSQSQASNQSAAEQSEALISPSSPDKALPFLLDLTELTIESYIDKHGLEDKMSHQVTAAATRIAKITVNPDIFNQEALAVGRLIRLRLFDQAEYIIRVTNYTAGSPASISGATEKGQSAYFYAGINAGKILATLEIPGLKKIYLVRFSPKSKEHYLFQAVFKDLASLEDAPPKIPPASEQ